MREKQAGVREFWELGFSVKSRLTGGAGTRGRGRRGDRLNGARGFWGQVS